MTGRNDPCYCGSGKKFKKCCAHKSNQPENLSYASLLEQAWQYYQLGDLVNAVRISESLIQQGVQDPQLYELTGVCAYQMGKLERACMAFEGQVRLIPKDIDARNNLGQLLLETGELNQAMSIIFGSLDIDPKNAVALNCLGNVYRAKGKISDARNAYLQAVKSNNQSAMVYCNLGSVQQELQDLTNAEESYRKSIELDRDFIPAQYNLAILYLEKNKTSQAGKILLDLNKKIPGDAEILVGTARYYRDIEEYEHAFHFLDQALSASPANITAHMMKASLFERQQDFKQALSEYKQAINISPESVEAHCAIGQYYVQLGETDKSIVHFNRCLAVDTNYVPALTGLAEAFLQQDKPDRANAFSLRAIEQAGHDLIASSVHVASLLGLEQAQEALGYAKSVHRRFINRFEPYLMIARCFVYLGQYDEAASNFTRALDLTSSPVKVLLEWAEMEERRHQQDKTAELLFRVLDIEPYNITASLIFAELALRQNNINEANKHIEKIESFDLKYNKKNQYLTLFARCKIAQRKKEYRIAFESSINANQVKNNVLGDTYDMQKVERNDKILRKAFTSSSIEKFSFASDENATTPCFIVGFPRSGTSLVEQIIASHTQVTAGDELPFINEIIDGRCDGVFDNGVPFPECMLEKETTLTKDGALRARQFYFSRLMDMDILKGQEQFVTDKMPLNLRSAGLISTLFPESPIIHVIRHPLDSCISAFMANFAHGHRYTSSLENTFVHYVKTMELVQHYKKQLEMNIMEIKYEEIVADQEVCTRALLDFIGLPWDEKCLRFYESKHVVKTASYQQVTKKIYTSARYRYKHYLEDLKPLLSIIESTVDMLGYEI